MEAQTFVDNFEAGPDFRTWVDPDSAEVFSVNESTREAAIKIGTVTETSAIKRYYRRLPSKNLEAWARSNKSSRTW